MYSSPCEQLDDYLYDYARRAADDGQRAAFEAHLIDCPACREQVRWQRQLDSSLGQAEWEDPPTELSHDLTRLIAAASRRKAYWSAGMLSAGAIAAAVLIAAWLGSRQSSEQDPSDGGNAPRIGRGAPPNDARSSDAVSGANRIADDDDPLVQISFDETSDVIALPVKTNNARVSIIWVYPTYPSNPDTALPEEKPSPDPRSDT